MNYPTTQGSWASWAEDANETAVSLVLQFISPQAWISAGTAVFCLNRRIPSFKIFIDALISLSRVNPHDSQTNVLTPNGISCLCPQQEHVLLDGKNRPIFTKCLPRLTDCHSSAHLNWNQLTSAIDFASEWFFIMLLELKSSITIRSLLLTIEWAALLMKSLRWFDTFLCRRASLILVYSLFFDPLFSSNVDEQPS